MKEYPNFFENLKEATIRLNSTIVLYDGEPMQILRLTDHKGDGIIRVYMYPIDLSERDPKTTDRTLPEIDQFYGPAGDSLAGQFIDKWMETHPRSPLLRKQMNSPKFNKFRPFPLGMCNFQGACFYIERQPTRKTEQGLTKSALIETSVKPGTAELQAKPPGAMNVNLYSKAFVDCIKAEHPSAAEALKALLDPSVKNEAVAFDRYFAFVRGPIGMIFLVYKGGVVGVLPDNSLDRVKLAKKSAHILELTQNLKVFRSIVIGV